MSSLGELYFSLGLDSQKFDDAIKEAKKKVAELTGEASITINADASNVAAQVQDDLNKITGKKTEIKLGIDKSSKASVEDLVKDIANAEKELERLKSKESWNTSAIERQEGFISSLKKQLEEAKAVKVAATEAKEAIKEISQPTQTVQHVVSEEAISDVKALTDAMKSLNEQMEVSNRLREGQQRANAQSKEEAKQRKISAQWLNETRRQNKEIAQLQKEEEAMRSSVSSKWIEEARQKNAELRKEESAAAKQRVADAKASNKALQSQLSQLFKLEEAIKKLQNLRIRINFSGIDQNSENFKKAASALDAYIDKLQQLQGSGRTLSKREVSSVLGMSMKSVIDESDRYVKEQKAIEKSLIKALSEGSASSVVIDKKTTAMNKFQKAIVGTTNWASQLNNQLGNAFSIYAIERFIRSLYTVGGEFQKQQIALQNMIGDTAKADVIFDRMKDLAVTSPFTFSELASYTKQMSAYGIEYEELYDTTKRLADISAGVGVDMGRLILAYGQVRSAEVLRGQELRQFTEAGIPLVAELAKRLEEVRGKSVQVGEVFDAISKREISFDMVKDVLFDMTDPGGRFFETQEKLAESLAGKWSNLKDAWDIMIADIANGNNSTLKSLAEVTAWLVKNWEAWLPLITGAAAALGTYRTVMAVVIPLQQAFNILTKANPWIAIASGVIGAAAAIYGYATDSKTAADELKELNHELDKNIQKNKENEQTANRYLDSLKSQNTSEEQRIRLFEELKSLYPDIFKDMKMEQVLLADTIELKNRMAKATKDMTLADYDELLVKAEKNRIELQKKYDDTYIQTGATGKRNKWYDQLEDVKAEIRKNKEERAALEKELDWNKNVSSLGDKSTLEEYINLYGEIGKAIKILRDSGIKDESLVKPEQGIPLDEYYDRLNGALQKQKDIMTKFGADTTMHQNAEKIKKVYESAIKSIGGVIGGNQKPTSGKSEAEKAAERDAKAYLDALKERLKEIGSQWSLFKELMDATGNRQLSLNLSGLSGTDFRNQLEHLRSEMTKELQKTGVNLSAADVFNMNFDELAKIVGDEEKLKRIKEIYDTYHNANRDLRMETIKDFAEIIKASRDFESKIAEIERKLQEDLSKLRLGTKEGGLDLNSDEYKRAEAKLREEAEKAKANERFEEFKASSDWVKVFDDLDRVATPTLNDMLDKMEAFIYQVEESPEAMKEMLKALGDVREKLSERNPFGAFTRWLKEIRNIKAARWLLAGNDSYTFQQDLYGFKAGQKITPEILDNLEKSAVSDFNLALAGTSAAFENLKSVIEPVIDLFNHGVDSVSIFLSAIGGALSGALNMGQSFEGLMGLSFGKDGEKLGSMLGIKNAGFWGAAAGAALGAISAISEAHDKKLDKAIRKSQLEVQKLGNEYKNLEHTIERQLGSQTSSQSKVMINNLRSQRRELMEQYGLEDEKKKTDASKLEDYKQQINELDQQIKYFYEDLAKEQYDADIKDWAGQIASALVEAFASGENAAAAFDDTVGGILRNLATEAIRLQFIEPAMAGLRDFMFGNVGVFTDLSESGSDLSANEAIQLQGELDKLKGQIEKSNDYWDKINEAVGGIMDDTESAASGGLSKGVQSVTEDTANLLGSYLNSIRHDSSVQRTLIEHLVSVDVPKMSIIAQAQLQQLQQVAANTKRNADAADRIYELVNKVVDKGSNKLKV